MTNLEMEQNNSGTAKIIDLYPRTSDSASASRANPFLSMLGQFPEALEDLKSFIETLILEASMKTNELSITPIDDPFSSVYLSELNPDPVTNSDAERINQYYNIIDISDTIHFEDDWEE